MNIIIILLIYNIYNAVQTFITLFKLNVLTIYQVIY